MGQFTFKFTQNLNKFEFKHLVCFSLSLDPLLSENYVLKCIIFLRPQQVTSEKFMTQKFVLLKMNLAYQGRFWRNEGHRKG